MFSKVPTLVVMALILIGLSAHADTYFCKLSDPSRGKATLKFSPDTKTIEVKSQSAEMNQFQGIQGKFDTETIDQSNASPDLKDDLLIHFNFSDSGSASLRFYTDSEDKGVTIAEFIPGVPHSIGDFPFACCVDKKPISVPSGFGCK
jgi:hypothetical protein